MFLFGLILGMALAGFIASQISFQHMEKLTDLLRPPVRPYAAYVESLEKSLFSESVAGKAWLQAGKDALRDSTQILPPHLESGYIAPLEHSVIAYQIKPRKGQLLSIHLELLEVIDSPQVFIELFERIPGQAVPKLVAYADSGSFHLNYEVEEDETYLLRIQPELMARFSYRLRVVLGASLAFPVDGKDSKAIRSFWGDPRDGGRRKHKGIDIFARRGTPVLAAIDGTISRVKEGGLGGKVVWQRDPGNRFNLYYAHLDTQMVRRGQIVRVGDTLGLVGNTGNARSTPPHLHFGIYQRRRGAVDPFPFVHQPDTVPPRMMAEESGMLQWVATRKATRLMNAPSSKASLIRELSTSFPLQRLAATGTWHRVQLPDGSTGFVSHTDIHSELKPLRRITLDQQVYLLDQFEQGIVTDSLPQGTEVEILAASDVYQYIRTASGQLGYLRQSPDG